MNDGLPPLPEFPVGTMTVTYGVDRKVKVPVFDERQLREYAKQAVEAETHRDHTERLEAEAAKHPWVGLTDADLEKVFPAIGAYHEENKTLYRSIARIVEDKLKEKNT